MSLSSRTKKAAQNSAKPARSIQHLQKLMSAYAKENNISDAVLKKAIAKLGASMRHKIPSQPKQTRVNSNPEHFVV